MVVGGMGRKDRGMKDGGDDRWGGVNKDWKGGDVSTTHLCLLFSDEFRVAAKSSQHFEQLVAGIIQTLLWKINA